VAARARVRDDRTDRPPRLTLDVDIGVRLGTLDLDARLDVKPGELVAILGPNGAGKSTVLRCIAGLLAVDRGYVRVDDEPVDDPAAEIFVPAERRSIGVVFQDFLLFETMSALENVAFGLRARGTDKRAARRIAGQWLARVGLDAYADDHPRNLSGGQAQRVALARALAIEPRVLLLDEPLAALDAGTRSTVRRDLRRHFQSFDGMRLLVTHDPVDAYALADRVVVLEAGRIIQTGTLADVTAHPRSRYVADLVGLNLIAGTLTDRTLTTPNGGVVVVADHAEDGPAFATIRPNAVALHRHQPEGSARNVWHLTVADIDQYADRARVTLAGTLAVTSEITAAALVDLDIRLGENVWASVKATDIIAYAV